MRHFIILIISLFSFAQAFAQSSYTWNGSSSSAWNTASNWSPNGVPGSADNINIVTAANPCVLSANQTITNLTVTTGTLNLGGFTLNVTGTSALNGGNCINGTFNASGTSLTFAGTTLGANITASVSDVYFNGSTFNGNVNITRNNSSNIQSTGNNVFNGNTAITNAGTGYLLMTNSVAKTDVFNGPVTFNTTGGGNIYIGYNGNATYNASPIINNTASAGNIYFGGSGGTTTLGTGVTISCGTFTGGTFYIYKLVQSDASALNLNPGANGGVFLVSSTLTGALTVTAGNIYTQASTYNGTVVFNKNGGTNNSMSGNNTFNSTLTLNHSGAGYWGFGNGTRDIFNGDIFLNNTCNNERIIIGQNSSNNQFNGNVTVTQSGTAQGVWLGFGGTAPVVTLAAGKTINVSPASVTAGYVNLYGFVQSGSSALSYSVANTAGIGIYNSTFNGDLGLTGGNIYCQNSTLNGNTTFNKNGGTNNTSSGGNTFNGTLTMNHSGSGYWGFGNGTRDIFNADVYLNNTSNAERIIIGQSSSNNLFNGNVYVTQSGAAQGIALGWSGASPITQLAAGKTVIVGAGGFSAGYLQLYRIAQTDATPLTLTTTGTSSVKLQDNTFISTVDITTPDIYPLGGTYNGAVHFVKTGGNSGNHNSGLQNIFNSTLSLENQSNTGYILLSYNSADQFNGDITVASSGSGGISFGWSGGTGAPVLAAGKTILIGSSGYSAGYLQLGSFTQLGNVPINLTLTGTANFQVVKPNINCTFNAPITVTAPDIYLQGGIFNGAAAFTKTGGTSNHNNQVQNIFNSTLAINQQSNTGYFMLGYNSNDLFNDDITVTSTGTGGIYLGWSSGTGTPTLASGKTILVGAAGFSAGFLQLNTFTQLGNAPMNLNFTGTSTYLLFARNTIIGGNLTSNTPSVYFNGATFNGTVNSVKTGPNNDPGSGGNTFNAVSSFTNTGAGYLMFGNGTPDTWNADVAFTNAGTERILPCWSSAGNLFNGNITVSATSGTGIYFCGGSAVATATVAATKTIMTGSAGFSAGYLILTRFTQLGNAPVTLSLLPSANYMTIGPNSTIGGNFTGVSPSFNNVIQSTFNGTVDFTKTGAANDSWSSGNTFNSTGVFTNTGSGYMGMGWTYADIFNGDVTFNDFGTERVLPAWVSTGNMFNGNITVNTNGSAQGIYFCGSTGTATLAATKTISVGVTGYNAGYLILRSFTQLGNAPINLTLNSTATYLQYGPFSSLGGNVTSSSPGLYFHGCTFNSNATCTKTGTSNDQSNGNNIFYGTTIMNNTGSGYLLFGNGTGDQFNGATTTFNNQGSSHIYVAYNSANNIFAGQVTFNNTPTSTNSWIYVANATANNSTFNGNIIVNCVNGGGVSFGSGTGTSTLTAGKTITIGAGGFNAGGLILKNFTQVSNTAQSFTTTGTSYIQYGPVSSFDGDISSQSPGLYFHGGTFNRTATCTKNGTTNDNSNGTNVFNGTTIITNTGSGYLLFGNGNSDQFNTTTTFNNLGSSHIYVAYNSTNNIFGGPVTFNNAPTSAGSWIYVASYSANNATFNDNITVNCVNGAGVYFGSNSGTATLIAGKTISVGASGFNTGGLIMRNFTQLGATAQNITTTGTSYIQYGPASTFNGDITSVSPGLLFNTSTFNGVVNSTKNGTANDASPGGNIFNGTTTLTDVGTGYLLMANGTADAYNGDITFAQNNSGPVYPNYNANCTYAGNITVSSTGTYTITFGSAGNGIATLTGTNAQTINKSGTVANPVFTRLVLNKASNTVTLNTRINVSVYFTPTSGIMNTTQTNILNMNNASTTTIGNSASYVEGPMNYDMAVAGARTLNFPIGKSGDWRPVVLGLTHSNGTSYTYNSELFIYNAASLGWAYPPTINNVSHVHYWDIGRTVTGSAPSVPTAGLSGNQTITIYFGANDGVIDGSTLTIAKNTYTATSAWIDIGGSGAPAYAGGASLTGSVVSTSSPSAFNSFSRFTLANKIGGIYNPLPIELLSFDAKQVDKQVNLAWTTATEKNNDHFDVERSQDGSTFEYVGTVKAYGDGNSLTEQHYTSVDPRPYQGLSYYRLKQVDKSGAYRYTNMVAVNFGDDNVKIFPNPSADKVWVQLKQNSKNTTIKVVDSYGDDVIKEYTVSSTKETIDVSHLAPGVYYIIMNNGADDPVSTRIVVQ
ncbi:MAG: T9SS type A sorting domain-containing protein [Bacteroidetes bacterium]|nr:T9SS type A sorting domain-containing protein [Bacteroidota bacterium]